MTQLLLRLFIKNHKNTQSPQVRSAIGSLSGMVGIACNLLLFAIKLLAGTLAGSVSITADALNNLSDASGSIVTLIGFRLAEKPADEDHPYGHARYEYLTGLAVAAMIVVIGFELAKTAVEKILAPEAVTFSGLTAGILVVSIAVKLWMYLFNSSLSKSIQSSALMATAADSRNDCIATSAVLLAAVLESVTGLHLDGFFGLGVALFVLYSGATLARDTISPLLGENASPELRQRIVDYVQSQPRVLGYHDLLVHDYGPGQRFATLHVEMDYREDPMYCHELIDRMEWECLRNLNIHLVIHYDPVVTDNPELTQLKEDCAKYLQMRDSRLKLHDFRMVQGKSHMNLIFDVALPSDLQGQERSIRRAVEAGMNGHGEKTYHIRITFDIPEN